MAVLANGRTRSDGGPESSLLPICAGEDPYAVERYVKETNRLYGVLNKRLLDREFVARSYSIADMAIYPWVVPYERQGQELEDFPHLKRWFHAMREREAVKRAYARAKEVNTAPTVTVESKKILFGQTAAVAG
jgi:GST-like protein